MGEVGEHHLHCQPGCFPVLGKHQGHALHAYQGQGKGGVGPGDVLAYRGHGKASHEAPHAIGQGSKLRFGLAELPLSPLPPVEGSVELTPEVLQVLRGHGAVGWGRPRQRSRPPTHRPAIMAIKAIIKKLDGPLPSGGWW